MKLIDMCRQLSIRKLASLMVDTHIEEDYDYDSDDELYLCGMRTLYSTTDSEEFSSLDAAVSHQIELFDQEVDIREWLSDSVIFGFWKLELQKAIMLGADVDADKADEIVYAFTERMRRLEQEDWKNARQEPDT